MRRTQAVHPWTAKPLEDFVGEAGARLALLMTPAGQVFAQHGFTRAVDVMAGAALGAAIVSSTEAPQVCGAKTCTEKVLLSRRHNS